MKTAKSVNRRKTVALFLIGALILGAGLGVIYKDRVEALFSGEQKADMSEKTVLTSTPFSFDASKASGWYVGPSNDTSTVVFRNGGNCFVMFAVEKGVADENTLLDERQKSIKDTGRIATAGEVTTHTLVTTAGEKQYRMHNFTNDISSDSSKAFENEASGYVQLSDNYIRVESYCNHVDGLVEPVQALNAFSLDTTKL